MYRELKNVAVVDDSPDNLDAAEAAIKRQLPEVKTHRFSSAGQVIAALETGLDVDLIITDWNMEKKTSGKDVAIAGWARGIPVTVVTGGVDHGIPYVYVSYPFQRLPGHKNDPGVWVSALMVILGGDRNTNGVLTAMNIRKLQANRPPVDLEHGQVCATVTTASIWHV